MRAGSHTPLLLLLQITLFLLLLLLPPLPFLPPPPSSSPSSSLPLLLLLLSPVWLFVTPGSSLSPHHHLHLFPLSVFFLFLFLFYFFYFLQIQHFLRFAISKMKISVRKGITNLPKEGQTLIILTVFPCMLNFIFLLIFLFVC